MSEVRGNYGTTFRRFLSGDTVPLKCDICIKQAETEVKKENEIYHIMEGWGKGFLPFRPNTVIHT